MPEFGKTDCGVRCSSRSSQSGERLKVLFMHIARATVIQRHLCPIIFARRHLHEISIGQRSDFSPTRCIAHIERGVNVYPIYRPGAMAAKAVIAKRTTASINKNLLMAKRTVYQMTTGAISIRLPHIMQSNTGRWQYTRMAAETCSAG